MNRKRHIRFIINPISGTRDKDSVINHIHQEIDATKFDYDIVFTKYAGHAEKIAHEAAQEAVDIVVAVGGDGTVNEVARGLVHTDTALGIIPCGSGNGLARHLYIPMDVMGALSTLNECDIETLDYGKIDDQPFFCTCGVGFDAFVSQKFAEASRRGLLTYIEKALIDGLSYKPETYKISIDGDEHIHEAFLIACCNASQYGNNVFIAPAASMSDGLMDVTIIEPFKLIEAGQIALQLFNKTIEKNSHIRSFRCKRVQIHRSTPGIIHYDGDPKEAGADIDIQLIAQGIKIVVNSQQQPSTSPLFKTFNDIYINMTNEVKTLRDDFRRTNRKIKIINAELLKKLHNN